jgi:small subunit ribosomal protein S6
MHKYELTFLIDGKATPAKKKAVSALISKTVGLLKGKVGTVEDWGTKDLAYKIGKSTSGNYFYFPLELPAEAVKALTEKVKAEDDIIRYLLIRN